MEIFILILIGILLFFGIIGCIVPLIPGPFLSYVALLLFYFFLDNTNGAEIVWIGFFVLIISFIDYFLQVYGVKRAGGGKYAIWGSIFGILIGLFFFPPFGIILGAFIGAYIGAKIEMDNNPTKIAIGALWGFLSGTIMKLIISFYIIYYLLFS